MYIRCPKCGHRGKLPDRWIPAAQSLRCRKCRELFEVTELTPVAAARESGPGFDPTAGRGRTESPASFVADGLFSAYDDDILLRRQSGPGDSNYELTFTIQGFEGDAATAWDGGTVEIAAEAPSSDEIPAASAALGTAPEPWHHRFIVSWGRWLVVTALALIAISVPAIAYLLWRTIHLGQAAALFSPTLIVGFACAFALLMVAVPLFLLAASLAELARDLRRLSEQLGRRPSVDRR